MTISQKDWLAEYDPPETMPTTDLETRLAKLEDQHEAMHKMLVFEYEMYNTILTNIVSLQTILNQKIDALEVRVQGREQWSVRSGACPEPELAGCECKRD